MFKESLDKVIEQTKGRPCVIVGAGTQGRRLAGAFIDRDYDVLSFFDNDGKLEGLEIYGIPIKKPERLTEEGVCYVISVDDALVRFQLKSQLLRLGIDEASIICYFPHRCLDYHATLDAGSYKDAIDAMFKERFGRDMDWEDPKTYNEKLNWEKMNLHDDRRTLLADKYLVRKWVAEKIGDQHLTKQFGVWDRPEEIDFDALPGSFVLKANNGSGRNILVKDKRDMDVQAVIDQLRYWISSNYMFDAFEMHYGDIKPKIIAEEYLDGLAETVYDHNIYCFHDQPKYIWCIKGSHRPGCTAAFYDTDWNRQPFSYGYPLDVYPAPRPEKLDEMLGLTRILCKGFEHVRVDWYMMPDGRILFGEMTFQTWGGLNTMIPEKYDRYLGSLI